MSTASIAQGQAPAFPSSPELTHGITIRDYFAAQALQGWCANKRAWEEAHSDLAMYAYRMADAMLRERAK